MLWKKKTLFLIVSFRNAFCAHGIRSTGKICKCVYRSLDKYYDLWSTVSTLRGFFLRPYSPLSLSLSLSNLNAHGREWGEILTSSRNQCVCECDRDVTNLLSSTRPPRSLHSAVVIVAVVVVVVVVVPLRRRRRRDIIKQKQRRRGIVHARVRHQPAAAAAHYGVPRETVRGATIRNVELDENAGPASIRPIRTVPG